MTVVHKKRQQLRWGGYPCPLLVFFWQVRFFRCKHL